MRKVQTVVFEPAPDWAQILRRPSADPGAILIPAVAGRHVLVTGAGGFIGSAMVRALAASGAERIVLLEIAEQQLFAADAELEALGYGERVVPVLGNVCDPALLRSLFDEHHPELVLHAAALKHVPLMERNPLAAVATNSLGTWRLARTAAEYGVSQVLLVSTDKAVAPHSIMGASKRIAELAMLEHPEWGTVVRLANVIGSPCSVGPIFAEQIARGGPVTVTHREARRFFLTLDEVIALLGQAMGCDAARGIVVPDPGEAVRIQDLAHRMIAAAGRDVSVVFTEPRPGDKLDESLVSDRERIDGRVSLGLRRVSSPAAFDLREKMSALERAVADRDLAQLFPAVEELVPDYQLSALLREAGVAIR